IMKDSCTEIILTDVEEIIAYGTSGIIDLNRNPDSGETDPSDLGTAGVDVPSSDPAYIVYTSGTTGNPKGVIVEHRCLVNFVTAITALIPFSEKHAMLSLTTISFDIFGLETLVPLVRGTKVVIGSVEEQLNSEAAARVIHRENITIFQVTPSRLQLFIADQPAVACLKAIRYLLVGGEAFPASLHESVKTLTRGTILNLYGPAETTIWSTAKDVTGNNALNIGKPVANTRIYILNKNGTVQPIGITGELCIGGDGVARGYVNRPRLTAEKFITFHIPGETNDEANGKLKIYRTGDLARWLPDGNLEFLGRLDHQVKIRGFRIEPEEIQSHLKKHRLVSDALVVANDMGDMGSGLVLCAYIVLNDQGDDNHDSSMVPTQMREYLIELLPDYMVPSYFICLNDIPLTPNGKIDRKAL
ncbi:MAG: amino acid adenylation domain-containing protein, partial [bacterium]|nr:amino acid adenylation domain-containing protein [bacterium]